jgi:hypothetical protein
MGIKVHQGVKFKVAFALRGSPPEDGAPFSPTSLSGDHFLFLNLSCGTHLLWHYDDVLSEMQDPSKA